MINVPGSSASFPANVRCPATGDAPTQTNLGSQGSDLADRTAWLKANSVKQATTRYTSGSGTYTVPAGCTHLRWVVVAGGRGGSNGAVGIGGNGGQSGEIVEGEWIGASMPASLTYAVGAAGAASGGVGGHSYVVDVNTGRTIAFAAGGASTPTGAPTDIQFQSAMPEGAAGGIGVGAGAGTQGTTSRYGAGGFGSNSLGGFSGAGYGAGGGGGGQASGATSGGAGGGGGYGPDSLGGARPVTSTGAVGAPGIVVFIATVPGI